MNRIKIWGKNIPLNTGHNKLEAMNFQQNATIASVMNDLFSFIGNSNFQDKQCIIDNVTYACEILPSHSKKTFDDEPYLIPFVVPNSSAAVIIVPGGAFAYKSIDLAITAADEGLSVAKHLNSHGISAFVLWYRSNPYKMPVPVLDLQRAVRYIRFHADELKINPSKIGALGFSAGGFAVAALIHILQNRHPNLNGYVLDNIDHTDAGISFAGLIYPLLSLEDNINISFALSSPDIARNPKQRQLMIEEYDFKKYITSNSIPQFLCHGTDDVLINPSHTKQYEKALKDNSVHNCHSIYIKGGNHGFGAKEHIEWVEAFANWTKKL